MRWLITALALVVATTQSRADEIGDYVEYQQVRLRTYDTAVQMHKTTKQPVIVWVKATEDQYEAWKKTRGAGVHVFVNTFQAIDRGVVVGDTRNGQFVQIATLKYTPNLADQINGLFKPKPQASFNYNYFTQPACPPGRT